MARSMMALIVTLLCTVSVAASPPEAGQDTTERDVSFRVRVCEGDDFKKLLGSEAEAAWENCERPLVDVPVVIRAAVTKDGPRQTDKDGIATVGPIRVKRDEAVTLHVGCTKHVCLTLHMDALGIEDGVNLFLYQTVPVEKVKEQPKDAPKS